MFIREYSWDQHVWKGEEGNKSREEKRSQVVM
jgi:hypothetical protein